MKKIILFALLLSVSFMNANTVENKDRAANLANNLEKSLTLTSEQKTKCFDLILSKLQKLEELSKSADKQSIMGEKRKFLQELKSVLTEEQYQKWDALRHQQIQKIMRDEKVENAVIDEGLELMLS